jgi:mono/diheme cytochrome c family protein
VTKAAATIAAVLVLGGIVAGCNDSATTDAQTPAGSPTAANSALQTDSEGKTVTAPPAEDTAGGGGGGETAAGGGETAAGGGGGGEAAAGDVAAGKTTFEAVCQGCHPAGGTQAGVGPALTGSTQDAAALDVQITNGKGAMPGGLVSGQDKTNVIAYVLSIEG